MKIGMYTDDEILEHLTEGEGRGFLGRSMYDAIVEEINKRDKIIKEIREYIELGINFDSLGVARTKKKLLEILDKAGSENNDK